MSSVSVQGSTINNPLLVDQSTVVYPTLTAYDKTTALAGTSWKNQPGGNSNTNPALAKPGSYDSSATNPQANPLLINSQGAGLADGGIQVTPSLKWKNPS